ncbi:hypothetical protein R3W88_007777 [Solanum pinnatisectum]|uniref:Uncharacterized protein n=1 Tax=Solanum pinnatisectum TaxID=50273 RepID=A0AAV9M6T4_9SOLN|nr:hypothetical protein R3W88_007777 [Solanum pinnatisectum]
MKSDPWKTSSALGLVPTRNYPKKIGTLLDLQRSVVSSSLDFSTIGLLQQIELHMMLIPLLEEKFIAQSLFLEDYRQIISNEGKRATQGHYRTKRSEKAEEKQDWYLPNLQLALRSSRLTHGQDQLGDQMGILVSRRSGRQCQFSPPKVTE